MAQVEGGAMHYLEGAEGAAALFEDLRRFVVPVAYGLSVNVQPGPGLQVAEVYGVPNDRVTIHPDGSASFRASTVFFDPIRRGAVVRLAPTRPDSDAALHADATIRFSYRLPESGERYRGQRAVSHRGTHHDAVADFPNREAYLAYALVSYAEQFQAGLVAWHQSHRRRAIRHMRSARHYLNFDRGVTHEARLDQERETIDQVLAAMGDDKT